MGCGEFKELLLKLRTTKCTPEEDEAIREHSSSCDSCYMILFNIIREEVDKQFEKPPPSNGSPS